MCELPATETPATLGELIAHLGEENPALGRILEVSSFLVNERSARLDTELMPGVRVDVLPPLPVGESFESFVWIGQEFYKVLADSV